MQLLHSLTSTKLSLLTLGAPTPLHLENARQPFYTWKTYATINHCPKDRASVQENKPGHSSLTYQNVVSHNVEGARQTTACIFLKASMHVNTSSLSPMHSSHPKPIKAHYSHTNVADRTANVLSSLASAPTLSPPPRPHYKRSTGYRYHRECCCHLQSTGLASG